MGGQNSGSPWAARRTQSSASTSVHHEPSLRYSCAPPTLSTTTFTTCEVSTHHLHLSQLFLPHVHHAPTCQAPLAHHHSSTSASPPLTAHRSRTPVAPQCVAPPPPPHQIGSSARDVHRPHHFSHHIDHHRRWVKHPPTTSRWYTHHVHDSELEAIEM